MWNTIFKIQKKELNCDAHQQNLGKFCKEI